MLKTVRYHGQSIPVEKECTSLFGAWIINAQSPRDIGDHGNFWNMQEERRSFTFA